MHRLPSQPKQATDQRARRGLLFHAGWIATALLACVVMAASYVGLDRYERRAATEDALAAANACVRSKADAAARAMQWHGARIVTNGDLARYARQCAAEQR